MAYTKADLEKRLAEMLEKRGGGKSTSSSTIIGSKRIQDQVLAARKRNAELSKTVNARRKAAEEEKKKKTSPAPSPSKSRTRGTKKKEETKRPIAGKSGKTSDVIQKKVITGPAKSQDVIKTQPEKRLNILNVPILELFKRMNKKINTPTRVYDLGGAK